MKPSQTSTFLRPFCGCLLGFLTFYGIVFMAFMAIPKLYTPDDLCELGTFEQSRLITAISFLCVIVASLACGFVSASVAQSRRAAYTLASLIGVLGLIHIMLFLTVGRSEPKPRIGNEPIEQVILEIQSNTRPLVSIAQPVVAVVGIIVGSRLRRKSNDR